MKRKFEEIDNSSPDSEVNKCPICMDTLLDKNLTITKCGHKFCHTCLDKYSCKESKCPICRSDMETTKKVKSLCDCDIASSVRRSLHESKPSLCNLTIRIEKMFLDLIKNLPFNFDQTQNSTDINEVRQKISNKFRDSDRFKNQVYKFMYEEISHFSLVTSHYACKYLKDIFEDI